MPDVMKAVDIKDGKGPVENLFINAETPKPTPAARQALIKVHAFGLNRMDLLQREGRYPLPPQAPKTLGVEFSGTIESFGEGDHGDFKKDDEVFGLAYGGAYAEYIAVSSKMLLHKPPHLSFEEAAAIPETFITATQALHFVGQFSEGQSILWHAAASGVSIAGIQLAKLAGASAIYGTAGSDEKTAFVKKLGATDAFNYKTQDWAEELKKATDGKGVDVIVDFVGANYFQQNLNSLARDGHMVCLGLMSGSKVKDLDIAQILMKRLRVEGSTLRSRDENYQGKLRDRLQESLSDFESGRLKVYIDKVIPWEKIQDAHRQLEASTTMGKIVCVIS